MKVYFTLEQIRADMSATGRGRALVPGDCVFACRIPPAAGIRLEIGGDLFVDSSVDVDLVGNTIVVRGDVWIPGARKKEEIPEPRGAYTPRGDLEPGDRYFPGRGSE